MTTTLSKADAAALDQALNRALDLNRNLDLAAASAALIACNATACRLDFARLAAFEDFGLTHDVYGIINHLDPATGKLRGEFHPRCAR